MSYDLIIVGSGISSLSFAHYCARAGKKVLVLEGAEQPGGAFHSHHFNSSDQDFWVELGAHTCYNSYGGLIDLLNDCNIIDTITPREKVPFRFYRDGRLHSIFSQIRKLELLCSLPKLFSLKKNEHTVESYYRQALGARNYDDFFVAAFNAVPSQSAGQFPAPLLFKKRPRRKEVLRSYTFKSGLQSVAHALVKQSGVELKCGFKVTALENREGRYQVRCQNGEEFEAEHLALGTPVNVSGELLSTIRFELAEVLQRMKSATIKSIGVALPHDKSPLPLSAGIIARDDLFYSIVTRDTVPHENRRGFTFHFNPAAGSSADFQRRISEVLEVEPAEPGSVVEKENILPAFRPDHFDVVEKINSLVKNESLYLLGNYFDGMAIEDCIQRSRREFERYSER